MSRNMGLALRARSLRMAQIFSRNFSQTKNADNSPYAHTVTLPQTDFPMRANAAQREPMLQEHCTEALYKWQEKYNTGEPFVLHDGPPYANGALHIGHFLNKVLKDTINRFHVMQGRKVSYIPGWDCHGLPIEIKALEGIPQDQRAALAPLELRRKARMLAEATITDHLKGFQRWGIMADWNNVYKTMDPEYEAAQLRIFSEMMERGRIFRGLRPVYWSPSSVTALAESELEYPEKHTSKAAYISFPMVLNREEDAQSTKQAAAVIWTTTPWTIPANLAISVGPEIVYTFVEPDSEAANSEYFLVAEDLIDSFASVLGYPLRRVGQPMLGAAVCARYSARHPLNPDRQVPFIASSHVTCESGTGMVHTAPGHGHEDWAACRNAGIMHLTCPVDARGKFTAEADQLAPLAMELAGAPLQGLEVLEGGNEAVLHALSRAQRMLAVEDYAHKYPYDWRTKQPIIVRATEQWFADLGGGASEAAQASLSELQFVPASGRARLASFQRSRDMWCISRQRAWGVPIPVFYEEDTGEVLATRESMQHVAMLVERHGTNVWWELPVEELLAPEYRSNGKAYVKGMDTLDVWFDSGSSWAAALQVKGVQLPADVYLEGSDQHRGWFQSSLQTSTAVGRGPPYKTVVTHGFVLDPNKQKMSKSLGNVVDPMVVINGGKDKKKQPAYGADVLRLWVASSDYMRDVLIGPELIADSSLTLRNLRNCARFMLGNLEGFDPQTDLVPYEELPATERYMLHKASNFLHECNAAYETFRLRNVVQATLAFSRSDLSAFYFDVAKDRLYNEPVRGADCRAARTVLWHCLQALTQVLAPIVPHTAEDIYQHMPQRCREAMERFKT